MLHLLTFAHIAHHGQHGGALGFQFVSAEAAQAWVNAYYNSYTKRLDLLADYVTNPNIAVVCGFMCAETDEEAQQKAEGWTFFQFALVFYNTHGPVEPDSVSLWEEYQRWRTTPEGEKARRARAMIGTPEQLRRRLRKFEESNIDQVILLNQAGKNTHEDICESLELFASQVMPEFVERDPIHQEWKDKVLAGEIELEEVDTAAYRLITNQTPSARAREMSEAGTPVQG